MLKGSLIHKKAIYIVALSLYVLLAVCYGLHRSEAELFMVGGLALIASAILIQKDFVAALSLTILVTHIGPILKQSLPAIGMVNLGDAFLFMIILTSLVRHLYEPVYLG